MKALKTTGKIILILLPVILVWIYLAVFPVNYMDGEYSYYQEAKDYRRGKTSQEKADVLILGDSRAKSAFLPELLDELGGSENCVSLAQGGSTSVEAYYALKEYMENMGVPDKVVLSVSAYHFTSFDGFWTRTVYFDTITYSDAMDVIRAVKKNGEKQALKDAGGDSVFTLLEYKIQSPTKYMTPLVNSFSEDRRQINEDAYREMEEHKGFKTFVSWWPVSGEYDMTEFVMLKTLDEYYRKILDLCNEYDIELYSMNTPLIETTFEECRKIWEPFMGYFKDLKNDYPEDVYPGIHIETTIESYDEKYFDDADHLNEEGARVYTKWFYETYLEAAS
ncbi:MAG: hypothetical protein IKZ95_06220 [Lachnospiraceae bacterium]|nr:hypothetical protein [Lachnospiraceae bacterium]